MEKIKNFFEGTWVVPVFITRPVMVAKFGFAWEGNLAAGGCPVRTAVIAAPTLRRMPNEGVET